MFVDRRGVQRWRCWSGDHGGTAIDALVLGRGMSIRSAIEELEHLAGLPAATDDRRHVSIEPSDPEPPGLHPAVARYVESCERMLSSRAAEPVLDWLVEERSIRPEVLRANRVGADPGRELFRRAYGLPRGGLAAVFPALDPSGDITYVQTRYVSPAEGQSKYDNPVARLGSNPRVSFVRPAVSGAREALLICEGLPDAYVAASSGFEAIAVLGAGYPDRRVVDAIVRHQPRGRVVVAFDNDDAGRRGNESLVRMLGERGVGPETLTLPDGVNDLSDWARADHRWPSAVPGVKPDLVRPWVARNVPAPPTVAVPEIGAPGLG